MTRDRGSDQLADAVRTVLAAVLADPTTMDLPSVVSTEAVALTAFDAADGRTVRELTDALDEQLRSAGWTVDDRRRSDAEPSLYAAKPDVGGGAFGVQATAISFNGLVDRG
ncbi:hypothetical protein OG372_15825 [Streptomyces sp. NBC_01020]|uniref:hypothetical protein n=1 Tax=unclassified Streptomyces TaxID=2593676 RepID=UPI003248C540|nr:hypothetical protein OG372_15825 [Streptomyces sp. NBC_01020]WSX68990.1 hypothetical protein OG221_21600 [Streptomyces sp. NBC_00932]